MKGYKQERVMIDVELLEKFNHEVRRRDTSGMYEPTLSRFLNDALADYMDEYFKAYPIRREN